MQLKDYDIVDFHTHPFMLRQNNICSHTAYCHMSAQQTLSVFDHLGVSVFCGSVLTVGEARKAYKNPWEQIAEENRIALSLREYYGGRYIPGVHVHPDYVEQSIAEMHRMYAAGVRLIGELCPYTCGWSDYSCKGFSRILDEAQKLGMVVSFHSMGEDEMDKMVQTHPDVTFVAAHPGEYDKFLRHLARMKMSENYYLDLSGTGLFRYGMLRRAIDEAGADRILFGSDYPTCNPAMYVGCILLDELISDEEKRVIFAGNARRLLGI